MTAIEKLRKDLVVALRERSKTEASMIRTLIAAIENAEAVEAVPSAEPKLGMGHDVPRRELTEKDVQAVIERERAEVAAAIAHYSELGLTNQIADLEIRLRVVDRHLQPPPEPT